MSDSLPFALEARCVSELYLTTAWTLYAQKMRSKAEAHSAHLKALEACEAFEQQELLVRNGILNPMEQWARNLSIQTDPSAVWTVTFHDLLDLVDGELRQYDDIMTEDYGSETHAAWRIQAGSYLAFLRSLGVVSGESRSGRWEERKGRLRRAVGAAKLRTKRSLDKLREILGGMKDA